MKRAPSHFPDKINQYVPNMQFAADVYNEGLLRYSLGTPSAYDDNAIIATATLDLDAGASTTYTTFDGALAGVIDAEYGRNVVVSPSGDPGAAVQVDVYGRDYLGQPMVESIDIANGQTTDTEGNKAFKYIEKIIMDGNASNAVTATVGVGTRLGLPYKFLEIPFSKEDGTLVKPSVNEHIESAATVIISSANAITITAPFDGYITGVFAETVADVTNALAVMDFTQNGTGVAAGDFEVPISTTGVLSGNKFTTPIAVSQGDALVWTSDAGPNAGSVDLWATFTRVLNNFGLVEPDKTDPATITTSDPRGLYIPNVTMNGAKEIVVYIRADNEANSSDNGGLYGIKHYYA